MMSPPPSIPSTTPCTDHQQQQRQQSLDALNERLLASRMYDGLETEKSQIAQIYNNRFKSSTESRNKTELIILHGSPGTGKQQLLDTFVVPMVEADHGGYCIRCKCDQFMQNQKPHTVFIDALTMFIQSLSERGDIDALRAHIHHASNNNNPSNDDFDLLTTMIPALANILEPNQNMMNKKADSYQSHTTIGRYSSRDVASRFKTAMCMLFRRMTSKDRPLLFIMEKMHWADESSLDVFASLLTYTGKYRILFIATVRDDVACEHVTSMLSKINTHVLVVTNIHLMSLSNDSTCKLIADILQMDISMLSPLSNLIFSRSGGNRYITELCLRELVEVGALQHHWTSSNSKWSYDVNIIHRKFESTPYNPVVEKLKMLPPNVLRTLRYASCLGSKLNEEILGHLLDEPAADIDSNLKVAADVGLLVCQLFPRKSWSFANDTIHDAMLSLIPRDDLECLHYRIGRRLWRSFSLERLDDDVFVVAGQLLLGKVLISNDREKVAVAKLCLCAGEQSVLLASFQTADYYLQQGIQLLGSQSWKDNYSLSLELYNLAIEVAFCVGHYNDIDALANEVLNNAECLDDTLRCHTTKMFALGSRGSRKESIIYGLNILSELGEAIPRRPSKLQIRLGMRRVLRRLKNRTSESLLRLPIMQDGRKAAAMQILAQLFLYVYTDEDALCPVILLRMVTLSLNYGLSSTSCMGFVLLGGFLCSVLNDIEEGSRLGHVGFEMYSILPVKIWLPRLTVAYYVGVRAFTAPLSTILEPLDAARKVGIETGDLESSIMCGTLHCLSQLEVNPIQETSAAYESLREQMVLFGLMTALEATKPVSQLLQLLREQGTHELPSNISADIPTNNKNHQRQGSSGKIFVYTHFYEMFLGYMFGDMDQAKKGFVALSDCIDNMFGILDAVVPVFIDGLVAIRLFELHRHRRYLKRSLKRLRQLSRWALHAPETCICRQFLLEAEVARVTGHFTFVHSKYVTSIATAKATDNLLVRGLGNELAGRYYLSKRHDKDTARPFFQESLNVYTIWGANAKVEHLAKELEECVN